MCATTTKQQRWLHGLEQGVGWMKWMSRDTDATPPLAPNCHRRISSGRNTPKKSKFQKKIQKCVQKTCQNFVKKNMPKCAHHNLLGTKLNMVRMHNNINKDQKKCIVFTSTCDKLPDNCYISTRIVTLVQDYRRVPQREQNSPSPVAPHATQVQCEESGAFAPHVLQKNASPSTVRPHLAQFQAGEYVGVAGG